MFHFKKQHIKRSCEVTIKVAELTRASFNQSRKLDMCFSGLSGTALEQNTRTHKE